MRSARGGDSIGARAKEARIDQRPADRGLGGADESVRIGFLADALRDIQDAVYIKSCEGRYLMVNARGAAMLGRSEEQLVGMSDAELFGEAGEQIWEADRAIAISGLPETREEAVVIGDRLHTFISSKAPLRGEDGEVIGVVGVSTDISARTELEEELRRREQLLVEAQEIANVGSWEFDIVKQSSTWSPELYRIFGLDPEGHAPSEERFFEMVHPADRAMVERGVRGARSSGAFSLVHRLVRPDGEERLVICRGKAFFDLDRTPIRMVGATLDMTDYQRTADALRSRHAQLTEAEELTGTGVFEWDVRSDAVTWTDGLCRLFGREPQDFPRTFAGYLELVHPDDREQRRHQIEAALASEDVLTDVTRVVRSDGAGRWIRSRLRVIRDAEGRPQRLIGACLDVTDLRGEASEAD